jgi:hypothetical protein
MAYRDQVHPLQTHGKGRFAGTGLLPYTKATTVISGTASPSLTEVETVAGGETIILTIRNGKWAKAGTAFNAARQAIIDGLDSAQSEAAGWNVEVRGKEVVGAVVRTSDAVITITLTAQAAYATTATETITVTVPAAAMEGQHDPYIAGTFQAITT